MQRDDYVWRCSQCGQWQYGQTNAIRTNRTCNLHKPLDKHIRLTTTQGGAAPRIAQAVASPAIGTATLSDIHRSVHIVDNL